MEGPGQTVLVNLPPIAHMREVHFTPSETNNLAKDVPIEV